MFLPDRILSSTGIVRPTGIGAYAGAFLVVMHGFVMLYEEPTLRQTFEGDYEEYCRRVGRWWPK